MKKMLFVIAILAALASAVWAMPFSITCPYDGESMSYDHQVGFGQNAVCWYSHMHWDSQARAMVKHKAYVSCN